MPKNTLPEWEIVLSSAARLQRILPDAVLVGGAASAIHAKHRFSRDADHVLTDLRSRFDAVLAELESVVGWKTARVQRPVQILGSLDGIETGCVSSSATSRSKPQSSTSTATSSLFRPKLKSFALKAYLSCDVTRRATISISWRWRITWVMIKWWHHCNNLTICTRRKAVNPRCNNCKCNWPTLSHSI